MGIVRRLMGYIELSMKQRLDAIERHQESNARKFEGVKSSYLMVEKKALELKAEKQTGASLLTDDIKFFFNLVKGGHSNVKHRSPRKNRNKNNHYGDDKENYRLNGTIKRKSRATINHKNKERRSRTPLRRESLLKGNMNHSQKSGRKYGLKTPVKNSDRAVVSRKSFQRKGFHHHRTSIGNKRSSRHSFVRTPSNKNLRRNSRNLSNASRRRTNEKIFHQEKRGIKHLDFMHTLNRKSESRGRNKFQNFHQNQNHQIYSNKKLLKANRQPKRWERLYNLAAEKQEKLKKLQKEVHGYTFEGDPRFKESKKKKKSKMRRSLQISKRSRSVMSKSKRSRGSFNCTPSRTSSKRSVHSRERNTLWGSYRESGELQSDGSIMFNKTQKINQVPSNGSIGGKISGSYLLNTEDTDSPQNIMKKRPVKYVQPPIPGHLAKHNSQEVCYNDNSIRSRKHNFDSMLSFNSVQKKILEEVPLKNLENVIGPDKYKENILRENDPFRDVIKMHIANDGQTDSNSSDITNQVYFHDHSYLNSQYSQKQSHLLPTTDRVSMNSIQGKHSGNLPPNPHYPPKQIQKNNLLGNLQRLEEQFEGIKYNESDSDPNDDDKMPALVQEDISKLPEGISNLTKQEFLKMMMESYQSAGSSQVHSNLESKTKRYSEERNNLTNDEEGQPQKFSSRNYNKSNQSHINIQSIVSEEGQLKEEPTIMQSPNQLRVHQFEKHSEKQDQNNSEQSQKHSQDSILENSFSKIIAPLGIQDETGAFKHVENESEDEIDAMIDDYKKQLGLAMAMSKNSIKYGQGLKEKSDSYNKENRDILNKIHEVKEKAKKLILPEGDTEFEEDSV